MNHAFQQIFGTRRWSMELIFLPFDMFFYLFKRVLAVGCVYETSIFGDICTNTHIHTHTHTQTYIICM